MLVELSIQDFAIIEKSRIHFTKGFNVLTGETGAGKSIIIDAIGTILGARTSKEFIRTNCDKAIVEGIFSLENTKKVETILDKFGIDIDEDRSILITREIYSNGRSVSRVNGRTVTLSMLNEITKNLIDIHGQHEHQSLLNTDSHIKIVDSFGDNDFKALKKSISEKYSELLVIKKRLKEVSIDINEKNRQIDILKYQLDEIDDAQLGKLDEEDILNEYNKLSNIKEIGATIGAAIEIINSDNYNDTSVIDKINQTIAIIGDIKDYDKELKKYHETLINISYELQDLTMELRKYFDRIEFDEERLAFLEERINTINKLKNKYGNTIEEILEYRDNIEKKLNLFLNNEKEVEKLEQKIHIIETELEADCDALSKKRKIISNDLENNISKELAELNMKNVIFKVKFERSDYFSYNGFDKIEFLISTNPGEEPKSLSKIISGGEMSRIMLAFKSILADYDEIPCLIFDEIDTGISGRTAQVVGEKISKISKNHQVICISHLPQIAALGDTHFLITKTIHNDKTTTEVKKLDSEQRINELSRLLGGVDLTDTTKLHAKEMLEMSKKLKSTF